MRRCLPRFRKLFSLGPETALGGPQLHALTALPPAKEQQGPTEEKAGADSESVWGLGRSEKLLTLLEMYPQFLGRPARSQVTIPTELSRFPLSKLKVLR
jgi:hypothetical protein